MYYTYILICSDKRTYIGGTDNLKERLIRHQKRYVAATKKRLPVKLKAHLAFKNKYTAFEFENILNPVRV